ncbi:unnamed protein product [Phytophthora lilii]|uniref:Unnamed protein product n=1 Tax=Phytophthora lilii TaxID=2077276 RepID=A0A9W6X482_9STRA|nr:unnamed protein product [Phytophthora lilii]
MSLEYGMPIVLPPIGPLFASSGSPTAALLAYESEEQREQYEEDMARYFGVPLPSCIRRKPAPPADDNLRTPTSVQPSALSAAFPPSSSPVKKDGAKTKTALPLLQLDSPTQTDGANDTEHSSPSGEEEKLRVSRERNRLHAQRTRIRKRELLESLKERIEALQDEYELLKQAYDFHATAVCLLRLGNVVDVPCVQKLEQVGINATEEDGQLCDGAKSAHESDGDADHEEPHEHEKNCACHGKEGASDACTCLGAQLNANGKRPYASTATTSNMLVCSKEERERVRRERNSLPEMSRRGPTAPKRTGLRLPKAISPVERRSQLSPLHSIPPKFHDSEEEGSSSDDYVDTHLEEDLLMEIRTLVKKEKYLEQLEDQLREHDHDFDSSGNSRTSGTRGTMREYLDSDEDEIPPRRTKSEHTKGRLIRVESQEEAKAEQPKVKALARRNPSKGLAMAKEHYHACFVELHPVYLRDIRALVLANQDLHIGHLRTLSKNLFLFSALQAVNLSNNVFDDSGSKEISKIVDVDICAVSAWLIFMNHAHRRFNVLPWASSARPIAKFVRTADGPMAVTLPERSHGCLQKVSALFTISDKKYDTHLIRVYAAEAVAMNEFILHFRISVLDQVWRNIPLSEQWADYKLRRGTTKSRTKDIKEKTAENITAATEFSKHLAEQLCQGGKNSSLQSLGLCYSEISRRVVLNTVRMANRLTTLDLSFAFIGIPGAQVVAAALRIDGYSTLTQLNMRCNRTKSMGARAILAALRANERLTSLDLSHNEIRTDIVDVIVEVFQFNKVLCRLDLSENELIRYTDQQSEEVVQLLKDAISQHRAILSLGQLNRYRKLFVFRLFLGVHLYTKPCACTCSFGTNEDQQCVIQSALNQNRIDDDYDVLNAINAATISRPSDNNAPPRKRYMLSTIVDLAAATEFTTVWHREILKSGRISLKWRMGMRTKLVNSIASADKDDISRYSGRKKTPPMVWKLIVKRKCEVRGTLEDEAASALFCHSEEVAYCDKGDTVYLKLGFGCFDDCSRMEDLGSTKQQCKRVYIHTSGIFRLLARVQFPASLASNKYDILKSHFWWQLLRSSCWDPNRNHIVIEGTYPDMHGVVRDSHEVVFYLPSLEWMAGEYLQLSVAALNDDCELHLAQFDVFDEADGECVSAPPIHLPLSIKDEEESGTVLSRRASLRAQSPSAPTQLQLEEAEEEKSPVGNEHPPPTESDIPPSDTDMPPPVLPIRQNSAPKMESVSWALTANMEPILPTKTPLKLGTQGTTQPSKRRITYSVDEISPHALDRLGVNADILKKEKGMKKLGICDVDIVRCEELRRYTGVSQMEPTSKVEFMFGFNDEQLHRDKAIKRLGTSEQEIMDDYSRRVSRLGVPNTLPLQL